MASAHPLLIGGVATTDRNRPWVSRQEGFGTCILPESSPVPIS
ncbi:hypothetical protein ACFPRL_34575 [Pseudoclavibacter helvolus]